jgi:hypothetical protein
MNIVRPVIIESPISGNPVKPVIKERQIGNRIYVEASWTCPSSGVFLRKGLIKILDAESREDVTSQEFVH